MMCTSNHEQRNRPGGARKDREMNNEFPLRGLDREVAFQVLTRADELMRSSGGVVLTRAEAVTRAREDLAHLVGRTVSRSQLKRKQIQRA
jgi:hypothetical protein